MGTWASTGVLIGSKWTSKMCGRCVASLGAASMTSFLRRWPGPYGDSWRSVRSTPAVIDFRVSAPVSVRREEDRGKLGNHVSSWIVPLPVDEADPVERVKAVYTRTQELKRSRQALGVEMIMGAADFIGTTLLSLGARATSGTDQHHRDQCSRSASASLYAGRPVGGDVSPGPAPSANGTRDRADEL